jgi:imidazolonepropionase-like amidohydrolase
MAHRALIARSVAILSLFVVAGADGAGAAPPAPPPPRMAFVSVDAPVVALTHARVIDGTGAAPRSDQTLIIRDGKIAALGPADKTAVPKGARVIDASNRTLLPGLVGMHDHLYISSYVRPGSRLPFLHEQAMSGPRLYLASGVTTIRTTGSVEGYTDLNLKKMIDAGTFAGPRLFVTAPYLEGVGRDFIQMPELKGTDEVTRLVDYWADAGATSFKAYMHLTRAQLAAAVQAAHKHGLKITGHLCAVTYHEAIEAGIDNLEHGFLVATDFVADKKPDVCPSGDEVDKALEKLDVDGPAARALMQELIAHHVAITSTLPVFESGIHPPSPRALELLLPESQVSVLALHARILALPIRQQVEAALKKGMALERAFVKLGGTLLAGSDPTGAGAVLPGLGDQREVEMLVEAGFSPLEAIHIATQNGAVFLGQGDRLGTLAVGKVADIVVIDGDPSRDIHDIEKVVTVFKDGVGYDSAKLFASVRGLVGLY